MFLSLNSPGGGTLQGALGEVWCVLAPFVWIRIYLDKSSKLLVCWAEQQPVNAVRIISPFFSFFSFFLFFFFFLFSLVFFSYFFCFCFFFFWVNRNSYAIYQMVPFPVPWTNLTLFSRSHHSDAKYLTNGYKHGHSYCRRRIGNCTRAFEWHQFQWPWVISNPHFKVTIIFNVK